MSYTKQNFQPDAVLYAAQLNHMEDGIEEADSKVLVVTDDGEGNVTAVLGTSN